jgi:hypothetical protein
MTVKIGKKIVGYQVASEEQKQEAAATQAQANIIQMHEKISRPEMLVGSTYKIKPPLAEHALYITINDYILNEGTDHEQRRPFEVFINTKNMDHFMWIVALTRVMSAVFRKGGDATFMVEELKSVFDPQGGYWLPGGRFMPSLVAEIGTCIEDHMRRIGMLKAPEISEHQQKIMAEKRAEFEGQPAAEQSSGDFPANAELCKKCSTKATILMDGCMTCLNCGDSKCG